MAKIRREQVIEYLSDEYIRAIYDPGEMPTDQKPRRIGDFAIHLQNLLEDPYLFQEKVAWTKHGIKNLNEFFHGMNTPNYDGFKLKFSLQYFSARELVKILPSLQFKYFNIGSGQTSHRHHRGMEFVDSLKDITAIMPGLKEDIDDLFNVFMLYFQEYYETTGGNKFIINFYKVGSQGITYGDNYLKNHFDTNEVLGGPALGFVINNEVDLKKMVANLIYYMVKYESVATIREIIKNEQDPLRPIQKYALIASPTKLYTRDFLRTSSSSLSKILPLRETSEFYYDYIEILEKLLLNVQERFEKYSIYQLANLNEFRELFDNYYGVIDYLQKISERGLAYK